MTLNLIFKKRLNIILTREEREGIAKRIIQFMKECFVLEDDVKFSEHWGRFKNYYYIFGQFKCKDSYYSRVKEKDGFQISDKELLTDFLEMGGMFDRFNYHIRMNASVIHIKKLIEVLGNKVAIYYLDLWAKRNMGVAIILERIVNEIKSLEGEK